MFDLVEPVHDRYVRHKGERKAIEVWKFNRQVQMVEACTILRIQADIAVQNGADSLKFTFLRVDEDRWEGKDYKVQVKASAQTRWKVWL